MSKKIQLILLVLTTTSVQTVIAAKPKFLVTENLIGKSLGGDFCNDVARMLRDSGYTPENTCHWRFQPNGPNAQSPKWTPVDIRKHPEWVRDIAMMYTADGLTLSHEKVDARWNNAVISEGTRKSRDLKHPSFPKSQAQFISERKESALAELRSGKYRYEEAWLDINGDGKPDRVLARSEVKCDLSYQYEIPGGRVLFVV